jgi:hypothetical protein
MIKHRIKTTEDGPDRLHWECSCGTSGTCPSDSVDQASDWHIMYDLGETRVDTNRLGPWDDL